MYNHSGEPSVEGTIGVPLGVGLGVHRLGSPARPVGRIELVEKP